MRIVGHVLLWSGFLAAAFFTVRQTEIKADPWATISWTAYVNALGAAVIGVVILRATRGATGGGPSPLSGTIEEQYQHLKTIVAELQPYLAHWRPEQVYDVRHWIDRRLAAHLTEFADGRHALIREFGLRAYGQIMSDFATGERMINRAWCASADGYADEVKTCLRRAAGCFEASVARIHQLAGHLEGDEAENEKRAGAQRNG